MTIFTIDVFKDEDKSFVEVLAEPDVDTISKLQAELDDKNRVSYHYSHQNNHRNVTCLT